ncbi:hypothetical protein KFE17_05765 [Faecalicatena sp. Marseille-Q4148]|nr:hypothetical protein KFE17_05765 [Faecalicatena sp. Marseille-Q4148]
MDGFGDNIKKLLLAGIGVVATTAEKSKEMLDEMVEKGELTVEQGKALNEELKHNIKKTVKEKMNVAEEPDSPEEISEMLEKMSPEMIEALKEQLAAMEAADEQAGNAGVPD